MSAKSTVFAAVSLLFAVSMAGCNYSPDTIGTPPYTKGYTPGGGNGSSSNVGGSPNVGTGSIGSTSSSSELMKSIKNEDGSNR
jgi:hypothetical protein